MSSCRVWCGVSCIAILLGSSLVSGDCRVFQVLPHGVVVVAALLGLVQFVAISVVGGVQ